MPLSDPVVSLDQRGHLPTSNEPWSQRVFRSPSANICLVYVLNYAISLL